MNPERFKEYADSFDCDIIAYLGPISRTGYDRLCKTIPTKRRTNCLFVLATFGGDPHAGYRIARALSHYYPDPGTIRILVPHFCKSAGTLICIGAHELIMADRGEIGPLDIQVQKTDEMMKFASSLDIIRGLAYLRDEVLTSFRESLIDINQGGGLSTTIASEIASKLTIGMYNPILGQIDPLKLGEMQAALTIATEYGQRLNERTQNLKSGALVQLSMQYPAHGFVIDRKEVRRLFERVRPPEHAVELELCESASSHFDKNGGNVLVESLGRLEPEPSALSEVTNTTADGSTDGNQRTDDAISCTDAEIDAAPRESTVNGDQDHREAGASEQHAA